MQMGKARLGLLLIMLLAAGMLASFSCAMSPNDATDFVSKTNHYLLDNESAGIPQPQVLTSYSNQHYWVVVGYTDSIPSIYLPINDSKEELATGDIEIRELIKAEIVLSRMYSQKNSLPVGDWPFSRSNSSDFYNLQRVLSNKVADVINVRTELAKLPSAEAKALEILADGTQANIDDLSSESQQLADKIEEARTYEDDYFANPDTNRTTKYEGQFADYFGFVDAYVRSYNEATSDISQLTKGIAALPTTEMDSTMKNNLIKALALPAETGKIPSFSDNSQKIRTLVEAVFSASKSTESFVSNLNTRVLMNNAWKQMYGPNDKLLALNSSFNSLSGAAEAILSSDNMGLWKDQESVEAMKVNWTQATSKYSGGEYDKASSFASKAQKNAEDVLKEGVADQTSAVPQELLIQIAVILVIAVAGLFLFEKFYWSKRKKKGEEGEDEEYYAK